MRIKTPTPNDLVELYKEAMEGTTEQQYQQKFLSAVANQLYKDALWYRAYGMYWYSVKKLLIEQKLLDTVSELDAEALERVSYDNDTYLLLAAWAYHDERLEMGSKLDELHVAEYEDGTVEGLTVVDEEMEAMAVAQSF